MSKNAPNYTVQRKAPRLSGGCLDVLQVMVCERCELGYRCAGNGEPNDGRPPEVVEREVADARRGLKVCPTTTRTRLRSTKLMAGSVFPTDTEIDPI